MSDKLHGFVNRITKQGLNVLSVRVLQQGNVFGTWNLTTDVRRVQHSISKSFTCMAVGLAISEGKLSLNTKIKDVFPQYVQVVQADDSSLQAGEITLYNLLRMSSGHDSPPLWAEERASLEEKDWVKYYMSLPLDRPSGETFTYSSGDTFIISAIVQACTGQTVKDYLTTRLFDPLGIEFVEWETSPLGVTLGCAGLVISTEELSRFGQFLLQKGQWKGQQLVPEEWIEFTTNKQIETNQGNGDWGQGYGCQFWMCKHESYRADGAYGQFCVIIPEKEAVIAINSEEDNMQGILDAVWSEILPIL
ncbi:serine hydrolase domain-containing protein [Paenibacillus pini]|uniref:Beta-lactamase n=1 Tax=Paenibacillus pini JCM 16418 TaxID=1236976 RepID=W7YGC5_9BACL|nr:serine hydrolase [Paenibacillus pini]GAF09990.1 beta-lactamase [Paenibacillus pini JCM 16418]